MNDFDKAMKEKDVDTLILILKKVELTDASIDPILEYHGLERGQSL